MVVFHRLVRWLLCALILVAAALPLYGEHQAAANPTTEQTASHAAAPKVDAPATSTSPNIILITLDTTRADRMGFLGSNRGLTPNLDSLAQQSAVFSRAYAQVPLTSPSHATILTGTFPQYHQVLDFPDILAKDLPYAPDILHAHGYHTAAFIGSLALDPKGGAPGFERGFDVYNAGFSSVGFPSQKDRYHAVERRAEDVVGRALTWLSSNSHGPFFMWVHCYDPHEPYDPPEPYKTRYASAPYDGEIAYMDSALGKLFADLKTRGLYDGAIIAVMADHGESLGAHGEDDHGFFLYDETINVPLLIKLPLKSERSGADKQATNLIDDRVELVDVMPTLLQASGIAIPSEVQGQSLLGLIAAKAGTGDPSTAAAWHDRPAYSQADYPHIAFGWSALQSLRTGKYLYVQAPRRELYDQTADPKAEHNLAASSSAVADTLAGRVQAFRDKTTSKKEAPKLSDDKVASLDQALQAKLASLGYMTSGSHVSKPNDKEPDPKDMIETANTVRRVNAILDAGHYEEGIPILLKLIAGNPEMPMLYFKLGGTYMNLHQYDKAAPMLRKAIELDPKFTMAEMGLGRTLMRLGDLDGATAIFEKVVARIPAMADAHIFLEIAYARSGHYPESISEGEKVLQFLPKHYGTYIIQGRSLAKEGNFDEAIAKLEKAETLRPDSGEPHAALAEVYDQMGRTADAEKERAKAEQLKPAEEE
jgi:arylsulfatase A-like enzyme/Flp pilus assembly protein TadD